MRFWASFDCKKNGGFITAFASSFRSGGQYRDQPGAFGLLEGNNVDQISKDAERPRQSGSLGVVHNRLESLVAAQNFR